MVRRRVTYTHLPSGSLPVVNTRPFMLPCNSDSTPPGLYIVGDSIGVDVAVMVYAPRPNTSLAVSWSHFFTRGWFVSSLCSARSAISISMSLICSQVISQFP